MTDEDKRTYNALTSYEKLAFNAYVEDNPGCSFQDALNDAKISKEVKEEYKKLTDINTKNPGDLINTNPKTQKAILERVADWYKNHAEHIWEKVQDSFENVLNYLDNLIARGVRWIGEKLDDVIDWAGDKIDDIIIWLRETFS